MTTQSKQIGYRISVTVDGQKKRARKFETHTFNVTRFKPVEELFIDGKVGQYNIEAIKEMVKVAIDLADTNMRSYGPGQDCYFISFDYIERSDDHGFTCEQWEPFARDGRHFVIRADVNGFIWSAYEKHGSQSRMIEGRGLIAPHYDPTHV
jgi:hypothetical protein